MKHSAAQQLATAVRFTLRVKSGPDKGGSFQLLPPKVTIGRDPSNDISLKDPRVSRNQAIVEFRPDRVVLLDVSSRENVLVNGNPAKETALKDGDVISFGETELLFRIEMAPAKPPQAELALAPRGVPPAGFPGGAAPPMARPQAPFPPQTFDPNFRPTTPRSSPRQSRAAADESAKKMRFYMIVILVGAVAVYVLSGENKKPGKQPGLRTSEEIEADIRGSEERQQVLTKQREFKDEPERQRYEEAQAHYLQGFRDYQKGNHARAMKSFETARAIDPNHEMAKRYYTLASRARDEFVASHLLEGRRYREKNMFNRCASSLLKVEKALDDAPETDLKKKEAKALRLECETLMKERF